MNEVKAITATVVFEACAVNRDENIANNVQSLKKLRREDGVYTFFSRSSMRHHIFNALVRKHGWKPAEVTTKGGVIQFNIEEESILTSEELDFFGYLSTGDVSISRKAPVGLTKAVSMEKWEGDMAFYANHDLVQRARERGEEANPNPFSKEEHFSFYKYSVVVDLENIGKDVVFTTDNEKEKLKKLFGVDMEKDEYPLPKGKILVKKSEKAYKISVLLDEKEKQRRLEQFFDVIINGFEIHSSTESWSVSPVFIVMATTKLPVTLFNPYVRLDGGKIDVETISQIAEENTNVKDYRIWGMPSILKGSSEKLCAGLNELNKWLREVIGGEENP
ncbi:CRISPR-associated autoregulator, Cst2 family [Thermotoga petrophila RKU-1]|uniref:CRISPR-associated autoregulator, Cst2 family n=1 Tax=Thermotoga petrophila (strain ATCC BAA-488 / DSM 13995 / JCM 10881 / RKU-1) TaxID=390874 RepID=A5ILM7_THEP1|nr:type I-B CRISPR-associated protein Cas7/Cst2/DevR [Thermotoga petrophila]ABQ47100.1 CRISPR-associated autoregulator, Cst2 family [Thermotoga petrophila RKU-1]